MGMTLLLVRHCEAEGNVKRVFQGWTDSDVTENGRRQLELLAERCRDIPLDAVYSSPLKRAMETAKAVNRYHHLPIITDQILKEIHIGELEGIRFADFPMEYPLEAQNWSNAPHLFQAPGGESMAQVFARMREALTEIIEKNEGKTVAVCSHGCAIRNALCWLKGWPLEQIHEVEWCSNTAISMVKLEPGKPAQFVLENDCTHIPADMNVMSLQSWWKKENREKNRFD